MADSIAYINVCLLDVASKQQVRDLNQKGSYRFEIEQDVLLGKHHALPFGDIAHQVGEKLGVFLYFEVVF